MYGNVFVADPAANLVSRIVLTDDGTTLRARKAYDNAEFLASTDERFRPVFISNAPDGALYIVDMYRGVIQDRASTTCTSAITSSLASSISRPASGGFIGSFTKRRNWTARRRLPTPRLRSWWKRCRIPNGWRRDTAQRLLVERYARAAVPALVTLAERRAIPGAIARTGTLDGIDSLEPSLVAKALVDRSKDVRVSAIRLAERWLATPNHPLQAAVVKLIEDPDWSVRQQLAASLGTLPVGQRETALATLLERHADDPIVMDAALSSLRGSEPIVLDKLLTASAPTPQRETAATMLAATIVRSGQDAVIQKLFKGFAAGDQASWQRSALLSGAEIAVLGAPMPGTPPRRGEHPRQHCRAPPVPAAVQAQAEPTPSSVPLRHPQQAVAERLALCG